MMSAQQDVPVYTKKEYDAARRFGQLQEEENARKQETIQQLEKALAALSFKTPELQEVELVVRDQALKQQIAMTLLRKGRPDFMLKARGSTVYEVRPLA